MQANEIARLEEIVLELLDIYEIKAPPIPVETMLQKPRSGMWKEVNINQLSGSFLSFKEQYSPRMSMARMLARHLLASQWGADRQLPQIVGRDDERTRLFARMLIMPRDLVLAESHSHQNPAQMSHTFEVPLEDARQRLDELSLL